MQKSSCHAHWTLGRPGQEVTNLCQGYMFSRVIPEQWSQNGLCLQTPEFLTCFSPSGTKERGNSPRNLDEEHVWPWKRLNRDNKFLAIDLFIFLFPSFRQPLRISPVRFSCCAHYGWMLKTGLLSKTQAFHLIKKPKEL